MAVVHLNPCNWFLIISLLPETRNPMGGQDFPVPSHGNFQHLILGMDSAVIGVTLARDADGGSVEEMPRRGY
jgi:hypothetical protein